MIVDKQQLDQQLRQHFIAESRYFLPLFGFYLLITSAFLATSIRLNTVLWWLLPSLALLCCLFLVRRSIQQGKQQQPKTLDTLAFAPALCSAAIPILFYPQLPQELLLGLTLSASMILAFYIQALSTRPVPGFYFIALHMSPLIFNAVFSWDFNPWLGQVCGMSLLLYSVIVFNIIRSSHASLVSNIQLRAELVDREAQLQQKYVDNKHLIDVMGHEFRTPLAAICNASQLLEMDLAPNSKSSKYLSWIKQMANSLQSIANELLLLTRIRNGEFQLHPQNIDIDQVLREAAQQYQQACEHKNLSLEVADNNPPESAVVVADQQCLHAIINIFVNNAIKFSHEGVITLGYRFTSNNDVELYVSDQGVGMEAATLKQLLDTTPKKEAESCRAKGLGLPLACQLAAMIEGDVSAYSQPKQGSTFKLCLPEKLRVLAQVEHDNETVVLGSARALVVEDEPINLEILCGHLHQIGYQTQSASTITTAKQLLEEHDFELLISDVYLPDGHGLELFNWIKSHSNGQIASTQLLAQTADESGQLANKLKQAGAADVLTKPYTFAQLKACLQDLKNRSSHQPSLTEVKNHS